MKLSLQIYLCRDNRIVHTSRYTMWISYTTVKFDFFKNYSIIFGKFWRYKTLNKPIYFSENRNTISVHGFCSVESTMIYSATRLKLQKLEKTSNLIFAKTAWQILTKNILFTTSGGSKWRQWGDHPSLEPSLYILQSSPL